MAERVAKKESGGERGARNLRAGVLQPSWGVASRCIAYLPAEMHVLARRQVRATPPYPSHHFVVLLLVASPELAPFSHSFHRSSLWRTDTNTITLTSARAFSRFPCFACRARSVDAPVAVTAIKSSREMSKLKMRFHAVCSRAERRD